MQRRNKGGLFHLLAHRLHHARVAVPQHGYEDTADGVKVRLPGGIPVVEPVSTFDHYRVLQELLGGPVIKKGAIEQLDLPFGQSSAVSFVAPVFLYPWLPLERITE